MTLLSEIYDISNIKGNLRGKAKSGLVRPTVNQFFTSADWQAVEGDINANDDFNTEILNTKRWLSTGSVSPTFNNGRVGGTATLGNSFIVRHLGEIVGDCYITIGTNVFINSTGYYGGIELWDITNSTRIAAIFRNNNGVWTSINNNIYYASTSLNSPYFRIRRVGNMVYTDVASDGVSWGTDFYSHTASTNNAYVRLLIGVNQPTSYTVWFDNLNFVNTVFSNKFKI